MTTELVQFDLANGTTVGAELDVTRGVVRARPGTEDQPFLSGDSEPAG